jgi:hypothetical protein
MADIFVSYASEDKERIEPIAKALENQGWSVWWDRFIPVGRTWDDVIEEQLETAKCMLVIWSENSVCSHWVRSEASEGFERNMLVPVFIDEVKVPLAFRQIQAANLIDWRGGSRHSGFQQMIDAIKEHLGEPDTNKEAKGENFRDLFEGLRSKVDETISNMTGPPKRKKKTNKPKTQFTQTTEQKSSDSSKVGKIIIWILILGALYVIASFFSYFMYVFG